MLQLTRSTAVILMTHACEEGCALVAPALTNKWLMCTHVCLRTHNTYKLGCHSVGSNCSGWWVFLSPPVWLSIYISLQDHPIHPSLTSRLSVFHFVTFASQPACSQSCRQVLLKLKRWTCVHMHLGLVACVGGQMKDCWEGLKKKSLIHPVPFSLLSHYKTVGFSECRDEPQWRFHSKMELMSWLRLQITLQILITAAWQPDLNHWTLPRWTSSHSCLVPRCHQLTMQGPITREL